MGFIRVKTDDGIQRVKIVGDEPTSEEISKIQNYFSPSSKEIQKSSFSDLMTQTKQSTQDQGFDYETGADSGLRAKISFGETAEEQFFLKLLGKRGIQKTLLAG